MKKPTGVPFLIVAGYSLLFVSFLPIDTLAQESPSDAASSPISSSRSCREGEEVEQCIKRLRKKPRGISQMRKRDLEEYESTSAKKLMKPTDEGFVTRRRLPSDEQEPSAFETYVRGLAASEISMKISQFGYDLFDESPTTFAPTDIGSVGPDYLLGFGDQILITLWGKINLDYEIFIDSEGKIVLPEIGVLRLSGLTFSEAKTYLEKELSRYYRASEIKMNISMGALRSMRVFVVGKVLYPGSYTLSSLSTLINALFASGRATRIITRTNRIDFKAP